MREGVALSIFGYINFHLFLYIYDLLKLNLLKCIVLLLTIFFVIRFHTWASGSDDLANPISHVLTQKKLIDWLFTAKISSKCPLKNQQYCRFRRFLPSKSLLCYDVAMTRNIQLTRKDFTTIPQLTDTFFKLIHQWGLLLDCSAYLNMQKYGLFYSLICYLLCVVVLFLADFPKK